MKLVNQKRIETLRERERERESYNLKNKKGITLIALVITIIVLLVLSGTVISMITGEDGIIIQAQETKFKSELSSLKDEYMLFIKQKKTEI